MLIVMSKSHAGGGSDVPNLGENLVTKGILETYGNTAQSRKCLMVNI